MAEARAEEDEERLREPGGARRRAEHSDRNKPDQRHSSQGPLSSIRAVIKRTSRTSPQSEHPRERSRRPEITILSAEPLPCNTWFPGASGAFPPPPPPAPSTWSAGSASVQLPPPSYEQVIREKSREQNIPPLSSSPSSSLSDRLSTTTIATQTDKDSPGPQSSAARPARRPPKPPRPSPPSKHLTERDQPNPNACAESRDAPYEQCGVQTDFDDIIDEATPTDHAPTATQSDLAEPMKEDRTPPKPRPRSRASLPHVILDQPMTREIKVQTLVRLKDNGPENVFAGFDDDGFAPSNISSKYLQDLLEVFGTDESHVQQEESQQSVASGIEENENTVSSTVITAEPVEALNRPQPRPRTMKSKAQLAPKPSVFEVFDTTDPPVEQNSSNPLSPPVPAPRPLLNKKSPAESVVARPDSAPPGLQGAAVAVPISSDRRHSDDQGINTSAKTTPMKTDRNVGKRSSVPKHSRPPPPVLRKTVSSSQVTVDVSRAADASVPGLPPRPSGGRLRPPPVKVSKPAGSTPSPAATNQPSGSKVSKKAPPLPPRPKPGHLLYKRYSSKVLQEDVEVEDISKEQEEPSEETSVHEEKLLIVLDDTDIPQTQSNTLHEASEVKGQDVALSAVQPEDVTSEQQIQQNRLVVGRFAFDGEEGELSFSEGDVITLIEYVNEEWGRGSLNGRTGIFPLSFIQTNEETETLPGKPPLESPVPPIGGRSRGRAMYDFTAESDNELCLKAGDVVFDLEELDAEWFLGIFDGKRGIVPKCFISVLDA